MLKALLDQKQVPQSDTTSSLLGTPEQQQKIEKYQDFADNKLRPQLQEVKKARDQINAELQEYIKLRTAIQLIREQKLKQFNARIDVGCEFFMEAESTQLDRIMVKVSKEYFVELSQDETLVYVDRKEKLLKTQIERLTDKVAEIQAHIVFVNEAIREILKIDPERQKSGRQFL